MTTMRCTIGTCLSSMDVSLSESHAVMSSADPVVSFNDGLVWISALNLVTSIDFSLRKVICLEFDCLNWQANLQVMP